MGVSTRARYALRLMVRLARLEPGVSMTVPELARREDVSADYAAQLLMALRRGGLIVSRRGVRGGVALAQPAPELSVADVVEAVEGPIRVVDCGSQGGPCLRESRCVTRAVWEEASHRLKTYFGSVTLDALAARAEVADGRQAAVFDI